MIVYSYIQGVHKIIDEDGNLVCKLYHPKGTRQSQREELLDAFAASIIAVLTDQDPPEEDLFKLRLLIEDLLNFDLLAEQIVSGEDRVVSFKNSNLSEDKMRSIVETLNTLIFEFLL